ESTGKYWDDKADIRYITIVQYRRLQWSSYRYTFPLHNRHHIHEYIMSGHAACLFLLLLSFMKNCHHGIVHARDFCPAPPQKDKTKPFNQTQKYKVDQKYHYTCIEGYVRQAGTSTMIRCKRNGEELEWDDRDRPTTLICIPDPKLKPASEGSAEQSTTTALEPKATKMTTTMSVTTVTVTTEEEPRAGTTPVATGNTNLSPPEATIPNPIPTTSPMSTKQALTLSPVSYHLSPTSSKLNPTMSPTSSKLTITMSPTSSNVALTMSPTSSNVALKMLPTSSNVALKMLPTSSNVALKISPTSSNVALKISPTSSNVALKITPTSSNVALKMLPTSSNEALKMSPTSSNVALTMSPTSSVQTPTTPPTSSKLTHTTSQSFPKVSTSSQKTSISAVQSFPLATETGTENIEGLHDKMSHRRNVSIGVGSVVGVIFCIAVIATVALKLKNRRWLGFQSAAQGEEIAMAPIEVYRIQDNDRYIPVKQNDQ
ncbi:hypothetical protein AGOR_G00249700, partial [Albula goreensis]